MKITATIISTVLMLILSVSIVQANSLCNGREGTWISAPVQDSNFGNYYLGGMCDDNSCYHITISNDANGEDIIGLAFTCEEIGDGTNRILWVFVDTKTGEKQEVQATLQEVNQILLETLNQ